MDEKFYPVKGYEGLYEVNKLGIIRGVLRFVKHKNNKKLVRPIIIRQWQNPKGYWRVGLSKNGTRKKHAVHRILCEAFIKNPHGKQYVNHIDGNKQNNDLLNLEWVTPVENSKHAMDMGFIKKKKTEREIADIKQQYGTGAFSLRELSEIHGVHASTILEYVAGVFSE